MISEMDILLQIKCEQYWPQTIGESLHFDFLTVLLQSEKSTKDYIERTFLVTVSSFELFI